MKKTILIILVLAVLFGMLTVLAAGSEEDPLITKSYADGVFRESFQGTIDEMGLMVAAEPMIDIRLDYIYERTGYTFSRGFVKKDLSLRSYTSILPGSSFILTSGSANIIFPGGKVINITDGEAVASGTALVRNKRYFCDENTTAVIVAMATSTGYADGYHKTEPFPTTQFVERLYTEVLGRRYDEYGLQSWVGRIINGTMTVSEVAYGFIFSAELTGRNLSNEAFVELMYKTMLGRASDPGGKTHWVGLLNNGTTRQAIFDGFAASAEWRKICTDYGLMPSADSPVPVGTRVFVTRLYSEVLGRQPDLQGRDSWMRKLQSGEVTGSRAASEFIFSTELTNRNLSNAEFVELLYRTMLGRPSDPFGKTHWVRELDAGKTRQSIFDGFVVSEEFAEICAIHGIRK